MNKKSPTAQVVAFSIALVCAASHHPGYAQSKAKLDRLAQDARNLQVQAVAPVNGQNQNQRVALVIGNSAYKESPLTNPVNDARAIAQALRESGFSVIVREDADQRGMLAALREFGDRIRTGGTGLFYYAGHGMQIKGRNYLIPVGANIEREDEVAYHAVDAQAVLDKMEAAGNLANIMILDACRNNPFTRSTRSGQAGLAQMDAPVGTLVAYATAPGAVASDGNGANGLYTQHLLSAIRRPGTKVEDVFKQVRANVRRESQGRQVPWEATSLEGDFYFQRGAVAAATAAAPVAADNGLEAALWEAVKASTIPIEISAYLNRYPSGKFAIEAQTRLTLLKPVPGVVSLASPAPLSAPLGSSTKWTDNAPSPIDLSSVNTTPFQVDVDRRTAELLAGLQTSSSLAALVSPSSAENIRPSTSSNSYGFAVGDRWRYQTVEKFKQEVVKNWGRNVESFGSDGSIKLSGGLVEWTADGALKGSRGVNGSENYSPAYSWRPTTLRAGVTESIKYTRVWTNAGGSGAEQVDATLKVIGQERVKVPAGEFDSWRIEVSGWINGKSSGGHQPYIDSFKQIIWYVPELNNYAAQEYIKRGRSNSVVKAERDELTSFTVQSAENMAQR